MHQTPTDSNTHPDLKRQIEQRIKKNDIDGAICDFRGSYKALGDMQRVVIDDKSVLTWALKIDPSCKLGEAILNVGYNINTITSKGHTCAYEVLNNWKDSAAPTLSWLLKNGYDANLSCNDGSQAIHACVWQEEMDILQHHGASLEAEDKFGRTALSLSLFPTGRGPYLSVCDNLRSAGAEVERLDAFGLNIYLRECCISGSYKSAKWLLENGADYWRSTHEAAPLIHFAIDHNSQEVIRQFVAHDPQTLEHRSKSIGNMTPLVYAAFNGHFDMIKTLLELGADPLAEDCFKLSPKNWSWYDPRVQSALTPLEPIIKTPDIFEAIESIYATLKPDTCDINLLMIGIGFRLLGINFGQDIMRFSMHGSENPFSMGLLCDSSCSERALWICQTCPLSCLCDGCYGQSKFSKCSAHKFFQIPSVIKAQDMLWEARKRAIRDHLDAVMGSVDALTKFMSKL